MKPSYLISFKNSITYSIENESVSFRIIKYLPALEQLGNIRPLVPVNFVCVEYDDLLLTVDRRLFDAWIEVVVPSFSALLAGAATNVVIVFQHLSNIGPPLGAIFLYQTHDSIILLYFKIQIKLENAKFNQNN